MHFCEDIISVNVRVEHAISFLRLNLFLVLFVQKNQRAKGTSLNIVIIDRLHKQYKVSLLAIAQVQITK